MMAVDAPIQSQQQLLDVRDVLRQSDDDGLFVIPVHPKMDYEDIFEEPMSYKTRGLGKHIHGGMNKVLGGAFHYVQSTVYYIMVMTTGLFLSVFHGILFGFCMFTLNWLIHPWYKLFYISLRLVAAALRPMTRITLDPLFQSFGQCFSSIKSTIGVHLKDVKVNLSQAHAIPSNELKEMRIADVHSMEKGQFSNDVLPEKYRF